MPRGLQRFPGQTHFLTFSCHNRFPYLGTEKARDLFVEQLRSISQRYQFEVVGYVVMPEHVHLLMTEPKTSPLSSAIQALKVSVAKRSTERPFWLRNYYDFNVLTTKKVLEKLEYMRQNPVVRGLVPLPEMWKWSSDQFPVEP